MNENQSVTGCLISPDYYGTLTNGQQRVVFSTGNTECVSPPNPEPAIEVEEPKPFSSSEKIQWLMDNYPETYDAFLAQFVQQLELFAVKHRNYGAENISGGLTKKEILLGLYFKMRDKIQRFKNITQNGGVESDESLFNTLEDLANYSQIAQIILKEKWGK